MFRFTQKPSSGSSSVLSQNYQIFFSVLVGIDAVNVMATYQPVVKACGSPHVCTAGWYAIVCISWTNKSVFHTIMRFSI
jgi:hypothetical protein